MDSLYVRYDNSPMDVLLCNILNRFLGKIDINEMQGEKECSYYMKTGQCKFGSTCKFHHPEFGGIPVTPGIYPALQSASVPSPLTYASNWQMGRSPAVPGSYIAGSYTPMVLPSGMVPLQGWSPYPVNNLDKMLYFDRRKGS
jgi:hypothetical protein